MLSTRWFMWCIIFCYDTYLHWKILVNIYFSKKQKIVPARVREAPVLWGEIKAHDRKDPLSPITAVSIFHQTSALCTSMNLTWPGPKFDNWETEHSTLTLKTLYLELTCIILYYLLSLVLWSVEEEDHDCPLISRYLSLCLSIIHSLFVSYYDR